MTTRAFGLAGALCVACLLWACDVKVGQNGVSVDVVHGKAADEWKRSYHLAPGGHLDIVNVSGPITASRAEGPDVEVAVTREARATTDEAAKAILDKARMVEQVTADRVSIESRVERRGGGRLTVQFTLRLPPGLDVSLKTQDGGVRLTGIQGTVDASSVNGAVVGRDLWVRSQPRRSTVRSESSSLLSPAILASPPSMGRWISRSPGRSAPRSRPA